MNDFVQETWYHNNWWILVVCCNFRLCTFVLLMTILLWRERHCEYICGIGIIITWWLIVARIGQFQVL